MDSLNLPIADVAQSGKESGSTLASLLGNGAADGKQLVVSAAFGDALKNSLAQLAEGGGLALKVVAGDGKATAHAAGEAKRGGDGGNGLPPLLAALFPMLQAELGNAAAAAPHAATNDAAGSGSGSGGGSGAASQQAGSLLDELLAGMPGGGKSGKAEQQALMALLAHAHSAKQAAGADNSLLKQDSGNQGTGFNGVIAGVQAGAGSPGHTPAATASAQPDPSQLQLQPPLGHRDWGASLGNRVSWMVNNHQQSAELRLNPPHLGTVEVRIDMSHDQQASINFTAHHGQVREALEAALPRLREMLAEQGVNLLGANVSDQSFAQQQQAQGGQGDHPGLAGGPGLEGAEAGDGASPVAAPQMIDGLVNTYV